MANRRMFSRDVCESDDFLDLPATAQRLYFFLGLFADDEGFLKNPKSVLRQVNGSRDDLSILIFKGFVIPFESGVIVITHWKAHNYIPKDRFKPTTCIGEKALLMLNEQNEYVKKDAARHLDTACIQPVYSLETQVRLGKVRLEGEEDARARACPPPPPADDGRVYGFDGTDLTADMENCDRAEALIRQYRLPDADPTLSALLEDAEKVGWERLEAALKEAALRNARERVSVVFYRSILYGSPRKEAVSADPYANFERF